MKRRRIDFYTYSSLLARYAGRNGEETFRVAARYSEFELDFPPQLLDRPPDLPHAPLMKF
ncbi:MAG TPA: hypothetical protein VF633_07540 [Brevundimonas sp.]